MADVTGPIATLAGTGHAIPEGTMCDEHPDRPATHRVQGETDSFGSELNDMCDECFKADREEAKLPNIGPCDWCDAKDVHRVDARDYEEGMAGRVYQVCAPCKKRQTDRLNAAYDDLGDWDYDD